MYWFQVSVDDAYRVDGFDGEDQVGEVYPSIFLLEVDFLLKKCAEVSTTSKVQDEEV